MAAITVIWFVLGECELAHQEPDSIRLLAPLRPPRGERAGGALALGVLRAVTGWPLPSRLASPSRPRNERPICSVTQ